jgi:hypothetical protein
MGSEGSWGNRQTDFSGKLGDKWKRKWLGLNMVKILVLDIWSPR